MLRIALFFEGKQQKIFDTEKTELSIGRDPDSDILINNAGVSRHHARVSVQDGEYWIEDLGSTNGTWMDGERINIAQLKDGDRATVLKYMLQFSFDPGDDDRPQVMFSTVKI